MSSIYNKYANNLKLQRLLYISEMKYVYIKLTKSYVYNVHVLISDIQFTF